MDRSNYSVNSFLSLQSVSKVYQDQKVIDQMTLDLQEGTFLSLLGPSGSGKTTILRMIAGLTQPDEGRIDLQGSQITQLPPHKRNMGMVFQQYALFPHMTVAENVAYGLKARKLGSTLIKERVEKYLTLVDLKHLANRKPSELSGGQQQRVSLARALIVEPVVMLFDEPLSNLDVRLKEQMQREIRQLHQSIGFTAVYVTHDQKEALYLSDQIAVLNQGRIEQLDTPEQILRNPKTAFVADFFGYTNRLHSVNYVTNQKVKLGNWTISVSQEESDCQSGDPGILLIRPQAVQILDYQQIIDVNDHQSPILAKVVEGRYLGGETEVTLQLTGTEQELVAILPQMVDPFPKKGTQVKVYIRPEGARFFKENVS